MGCDVETIGKHELPFSDALKMAKALSINLGQTIELGYRRDYAIDLNETEEGVPDHEFVLLETIPVQNSELTFRLIDDNYTLHQLYKQHGKTLFDTPFAKANKWFKETVLKELDCHYYILLETKSDDWWFTFTNDIATEQLENFDPKWWSFCSIFTTDNWDEEYKQLNMYRLAQRNRFNLIACYQVYHCSDQGITGKMLDTVNTWI